MRGADVRAGRHRGDVGGQRQDEAGGGGPSACRSNEDDDRRARVDHAGDDVARGVEQAARCAQDDDDDVRAGGVCLVDDARQVFGRDRVDDAVEFRDDGERMVRRRLRERRDVNGRLNQDGREQRQPRAGHGRIVQSRFVEDRHFLRHTAASFADFTLAPDTRTPSQILAHMGDLFDWARRFESESGDALCPSQSQVMTRIKVAGSAPGRPCQQLR